MWTCWRQAENVSFETGQNLVFRGLGKSVSLLNDPEEDWVSPEKLRAELDEARDELHRIQEKTDWSVGYPVTDATHTLSSAMTNTRNCCGIRSSAGLRRNPGQLAANGDTLDKHTIFELADNWITLAQVDTPCTIRSDSR